MATIQFELADDLMDRVMSAVPSRHGWTDTVFDANGQAVPNPISSKEFFFWWLPEFLAGEVYAHETAAAQEAAVAKVSRPLLPKAIEVEQAEVR